MKGENQFHTNAGAAAADAFDSGLMQSLDTRALSRLYPMRAFNGWVKMTQIAEFNPDTTYRGAGGRRKRSRTSPLRVLWVLDLAYGKGGDLSKWMIHSVEGSRITWVSRWHADVSFGAAVMSGLNSRCLSKGSATPFVRPNLIINVLVCRHSLL